MDSSIDKTAEIENRLKQTAITPNCTCLFFKPHSLALSRIRKCENCAYASFNCKNDDRENGWCTFKANN